MSEKILKADEVATLLDVKVSRIYELTRQKLLPFIQIGERQYRYSERALLKWIENGGNQSKIESENETQN